MIAALVRQAREARSLTQEGLAELAEVSLETVGRIEQGRRCPSVPMLLRLAAALDVHPGELLPRIPAGQMLR